MQNRRVEKNKTKKKENNIRQQAKKKKQKAGKKGSKTETKKQKRRKRKQRTDKDIERRWTKGKVEDRQGKTEKNRIYMKNKIERKMLNKTGKTDKKLKDRKYRIEG